MADKRPAVPEPLQRQLKVEAGHRCAIPTCRTAGTLDLCHIVPWAKCKKHEFDNMIALCPNCHRLEQQGHISRQEMKQYKLNLGLLNARYGLVELRILEDVAKALENDPNTPDIYFPLPGPSYFAVKGLLDDGVIEYRGGGGGLNTQGVESIEIYGFTSDGLDLARNYLKAKPLL